MNVHAPEALPAVHPACPPDVTGEVLACLGHGHPVSRKVALAFAHPDDEAIGVGGSLHLFPDLVLVQGTDGVPPDAVHALRRGFPSRDAYAGARREEMRRALTASGQPGAAIVELGYGDQCTSAAMASLSRDVAGVLREHGVEALIAHPYEGGHPDHDSMALACQAAVALLAREGKPVALLEMASYHASSRGGYLRAGRFLWSDDASPHEVVVPLGHRERASKQAMVACHASQLRTLLALMAGPLMMEERFRAAPCYDFSLPPPGMGAMLHYEARVADWGMTGEMWREQAAAALAGLGLPPAPLRA